jgi:hypothetical protein
MANLQFQEDMLRNTRIKSKKTLPDKLIGWGVAKNTKQANQIILAVVVVMFAITIINLYSLLTPNTVPPPEPALIP